MIKMYENLKSVRIPTGEEWNAFMDVTDENNNIANEGFIFLQIFCLLAFAPVFGIWVSLRILNPVRKRCEGQLLRDELIPIRTFG